MSMVTCMSMVFTFPLLAFFTYRNADLCNVNRCVPSLQGVLWVTYPKSTARIVGAAVPTSFLYPKSTITVTPSGGCSFPGSPFLRSVLKKFLPLFGMFSLLSTSRSALRLLEALDNLLPYDESTSTAPTGKETA